MRKTTILLTVLLTIFVFSSQAQRFGVKGGLNITNLKVENEDFNAKAGVHIGPVAEFHFGDIFGLETGMLLTNKGGKEDISDIKVNITYLEFPVHFRAGYDFGPQRVYGIFGPYFGFALGGKYKDGDTSEKIDFGGDGEPKRFDAGLSIGACTAISFFEIGFTYNHGLVNFGDWHDMKNRAFYISVAYKFGKNPFK
ncbi:MAG: PorT family protein [Bacteroidetes bacterium]|nr:PorT family protein [Bacteroidota bacterium]